MAFALPTSAQDGGEEDTSPRILHLEALNVGEQYWFKVKGKAAENPELGFLPGEEVELHLDGKGHVAHNIRLGDPVGEGLPLLAPGETDVLRFTVPSDAEAPTRYWCEPHRHLGMSGSVVFGEQKSGPAVEIAAPGFPLVLTLVFLGPAFVCLRRR